MSLGNVAGQLRTLASALVGSKPDRDALAAERDQLLATPPPAPADTLAVLERPACSCPHCAERFDKEQAVRLAFASWAARVKSIEILLFKLAWGDETERDELGSDLAELAHDLLGAMDTNRARDWERRVDYDARGREVRAWSTAEVLGEIALTLGRLHRAIEPMAYLGSAGLRKVMAETRAAMVTALATPLKKPLPVDVAQRAGLTGPAPTEADKVGLVPSQGPDPSILGGTIRFSRKGRA